MKHSALASAGYLRARELVDTNLKTRAPLEQYVQPRAIEWGRRIHRLSYLPSFMENVYIRGLENLPRVDEPSPILAFSHKKFHDIFALVAFMLARPPERFHDLSLVAMAGLFNGIYSFRDAIPDSLKKGPLIRPLAFVGRNAGKIIRGVFQAFNGYPVYRDGADVPTEEEYNDPAFSGRLVTGMDYETFRKHAVRETLNSVISVQKDISEKNRTFVILPEGRYMHDGAVAPLRDFMGVTAFRKQRASVFASLTYDELCPDGLGRINGWIMTSESLAPPADKDSIPEFLTEARARLQNNSVLLATHAIAIALSEARSRESVAIEELEERYQAVAAAMLSCPYPHDPQLADESYRKDRFARFLRAFRRRWLVRAGKGRYSFNHAELAKFAASERTVNDLEWNRNNAVHLTEWLAARG